MSNDQQDYVCARLAQIAPQIATELSSDWSAVKQHEHYWYLHLRGCQGYSLALSAQYPHSAKGRIEIRGCVPSHDAKGRPLYHGLKGGEITVSLARDPAAIAREIARRLLPTYGEAYAEARLALDAANAHHAETESAAREFAALLGARFNPRESNGGDVRYYLPDELGSGHVRIDGATVRLEASLSLEQARAVVQTLRRLADGSSS